MTTDHDLRPRPMDPRVRQVSLRPRQWPHFARQRRTDGRPHALKGQPSARPPVRHPEPDTQHCWSASQPSAVCYVSAVCVSMRACARACSFVLPSDKTWPTRRTFEAASDQAMGRNDQSASIPCPPTPRDAAFVSPRPVFLYLWYIPCRNCQLRGCAPFVKADAAGGVVAEVVCPPRPTTAELTCLTRYLGNDECSLSAALRAPLSSSVVYLFNDVVERAWGIRCLGSLCPQAAWC